MPARAAFFFNDTATTEIYTSIDTLSLHDALPISPTIPGLQAVVYCPPWGTSTRSEEHTSELQSPIDISYAVFCLKKKKKMKRNKKNRKYHFLKKKLQTKIRY